MRTQRNVSFGDIPIGSGSLDCTTFFFPQHCNIFPQCSNMFTTFGNDFAQKITWQMFWQQKCTQKAAVNFHSIFTTSFTRLFATSTMFLTNIHNIIHDIATFFDAEISDFCLVVPVLWVSMVNTLTGQWLISVIGAIGMQTQTKIPQV